MDIMKNSESKLFCEKFRCSHLQMGTKPDAVLIINLETYEALIGCAMASRSGGDLICLRTLGRDDKRGTPCDFAAKTIREALDPVTSKLTFAPTKIHNM